MTDIDDTQDTLVSDQKVMPTVLKVLPLVFGWTSDVNDPHGS